MATIMFSELRKLIQAESKRKAELLKLYEWRPDIYDDVEQARLAVDNPPEVVEAMRREWDLRLDLGNFQRIGKKEESHGY